jgi:hypothetical protein
MQATVDIWTQTRRLLDFRLLPATSRMMLTMNGFQPSQSQLRIDLSG